MISLDQLQVARTESQNRHKPVLSLLVELGFIHERALVDALAHCNDLQILKEDNLLIDLKLLQMVPRQIAEHCNFIPLFKDLHQEQTTIYIAIADPEDVVVQDHIRKLFPDPYQRTYLVASSRQVQSLIAAHYGLESSIDTILEEIRFSPASGSSNTTSPTIRLINSFLLEAVAGRASDIHFEPEYAFVRIRYRVDGELRCVKSIHQDLWPALCVRLKILAGLNISETRKPQNGRFSLQIGAREVDFRLSCHPTLHGENVVVRILDKVHSLLPLEKLGYSSHNLTLLSHILKQTTGLVAVTGPTGSGKTTTLYSFLHTLSSPSVNIMTVEEPVEYNLPWIRQSEVKEIPGRTFAEGVVSILRQDPDIIFVGEVRDSEAATMALRAAMTGHQVYTTLHTNDVFGVVPRLIDLGIKPTMMSGVLQAAINQRLVRRLCQDCRQPNPDGSFSSQEGGCKTCSHTGYRGRVAIAEVLIFNEDLEELIAQEAPRKSFRALASEQGFISLWKDGERCVREGLTTSEELVKVLGPRPLRDC